VQAYSEYKPTEFDTAGLGLEDRQAWLVVPVGQNRDSGPIPQSNFAAALARLGGESDTVEVHRFSHWGPGWFELILVDPASPQAVEAHAIEAALESYPLLDEDDLSEREHEAEGEDWENWGRSDFASELARAFLADQDTDEDRTACETMLDELDADALWSLHHAGCERGNCYPEHDDEGTRFRFRRACEELDWQDLQTASEGKPLRTWSEWRKSQEVKTL
jgi:hypothetical protein